MKVLLVFPPNVDVIEPFRSRRRKPPPLIWGFPIGLGYIAAVLERNGFQVQIIDACLEHLPIEVIKERIVQCSPDVVGISMFAAVARTAVAVARAVKEIDPNIPVVMGGPHATYAYKNILENCPVDYVVLGEGEETMLELMQALDEGRRGEHIKGLAFVSGQEITVTPMRAHIADLDSLPYPARHLVDYSRYLKYRGPAGVMGSRGCSHRCAFCVSSRLQGDYRARSVANVVDELDFLRTQYPQMKTFTFWDDIFTFNRDRTMELCQALIDRGLNSYPWESIARVDQVDPEMLDLMAKAGCRRIEFGVESGSPEVIRRIGKRIDLATVDKAFEMTAKAGIEAVALFMIGNPGETRETIDISGRLARRLKSANTNWNITQIYPGTALARFQPVDNWIEYIYEPEIEKPSMFTHPCIPTFQPDGLDRETLKHITANVVRSFVFHHAPPNILKWLRKLIINPWENIRYVLRIFRQG